LHEHEKKSLPLLEIQKRLEETITTFDNTYSRFKEDSLLSRLNRERSVPYDHHLAEMITQADETTKATQGVFSIFIKEALEEKGYGEKVGTPHEKTLNNIPGTLLPQTRITKESITLIGNKGIDLGGIGKGYLIDILATMLTEEFSIPYFLINGGGDIYVTSNQGNDVELYLEHPTNEDEYIGKILLKDSAFCSSSSFKRRWQKDGKMVNHFIAPHDIWAASYLTGKTATVTDMYATVFCILSQKEEQLLSFSTTQHLEYFVIKNDGKTIASKGFLLLS
jgi:thiamine biosynthesis lipoprotein